MITVTALENLGHFKNDWLEARYHFSFFRYMDPDRMGVGALRVWNDDTIQAVSDAEVVLVDADGTYARFEADLADMFGVSRVRLVAEGDAVAVGDLSSEPRCDRCWLRLVTCKTRAGGAMLCDRCEEVVGGQG